jgi:hypothetical protein
MTNGGAGHSDLSSSCEYEADSLTAPLASVPPWSKVGGNSQGGLS